MNRMNAEVFVTVARLGSYRKAANKLGYTQAGISYIIRSMEEEAQLTFFIREFGGVKLTPEGEALLPQMEKLYECEQSVKNQIDSLRGLATGHIKLLSFNTVIVCWLPEILQGFKEKYPGIDIEILSCEGYSQAIQMLQNKDADCGFLTTTVSNEIEIIPLREEPDVVVVSKNHPLANRVMIPMKELENYPFIGYPEDEAPSVYEMARKNHLHFNQIMTISNDYGSFSLISKNLGFGIYPKMIVEKCMFPVKAVPTDLGSYTPMSLGFNSYEGLSLAAKAFVDYVIRLNL